MKLLAIYTGLILAVGVPIFFSFYVRPPLNLAADSFFKNVEETINQGDITFLSFDFGPGTVAENGPQAQVVLEHLLRKKAKVFILSFYALSQPFLVSISKAVEEKLQKEGVFVTYGQDYVIIGFKPSPELFLQSVLGAKDLIELMGRDFRGTPLKDLEIGQSPFDYTAIKAWFQFSGLADMLQTYIRFLETGKKLKLYHGCTSITVPESYIYLDSGQISGLLEGLAGSSWYESLLSKNFPTREPNQRLLLQFTSLTFGQLYIIFLIILGNLLSFFGRD